MLNPFSFLYAEVPFPPLPPTRLGHQLRLKEGSEKATARGVKPHILHPLSRSWVCVFQVCCWSPRVFGVVTTEEKLEQFEQEKLGGPSVRSAE